MENRHRRTIAPARACTAVAAALTLAWLASDLPAHGGQYRQPTPSQGAPDVVAIPATWRTWWDTNKEPYLRRATHSGRGPTTHSDDFYLGVRKSRPVVDIHAITADDRRARIVPALAALMDADRSRDVQSACLVALGKIGLDAPGIALDELLASRLTRNDQEVRETAALALGISGRDTPLDRLLALLNDQPAGRKLVGQDRVNDRVRTFAAYGLALIARRLGQPALQTQIYEQLHDVLHDRKIKSRDLRVAAVLGIGILRKDAARAADKRLAWRAIEDLLAWFEQDKGAGEELIQGHAPVSIARLLGPGSSRLHQRCKQAFLKTLTASSRRGNAILRGSAIALGVMAQSAEQHADDAEISTGLRKAYSRGLEPHVRMFSAIAVAKIGGKSNRDWLLREYPRSSKAMEKPWIAIALGVLAAESKQAGHVDEEIANLLLDELRNASQVDMRTPLTIAVGLCGHEPASPTLLAMLADRADNERFAAYLCTSIGLLGDHKAIPALIKVLETSKRRPFVLQQCAIALGQLGDATVTKRLVDMLRSNDSVAVLSSVATAISRIRDRRAVDSLIALTKDKEIPALGRAFVAAALGGVGDKDLLPWNHPLTKDANFADPVDTLTNGSSGVLDIL